MKHWHYWKKFDPSWETQYVYGNEKSNGLYGGLGPDVIFGYGGKDKMYGGWGNDLIYGGKGKDMLYGGLGDDVLHGEKGKDTLRAGRGNDTLYGGHGKDTLYGGWGHDWLNGGKGNDSLYGQYGHDTYYFTVLNTPYGVIGDGKDKIHGFDTYSDTLAFGGDIKSLSDLEDVVHSVKSVGRTLKIKFEDGSKIILKGEKWGKINDVYDLNHKVNIEFVKEYRTIDGKGNNYLHDHYGKAQEQFVRWVDSDYGDGLSTPAGEYRPSARVISNEIFDQSGPVNNSFQASDMFWLWGQFLDHDIDLAEGSSGESFHIQVPLGDPYFDPYFTGTQVIPFSRTAFDTTTGIDSPREHINGITSFIDASGIYGSDAHRESYLRGEGGKLKVSAGDLLPFNNGEFENAGGHSTELFLAGDVRANENAALSSMHTVFVREHNRLVDELKILHPDYTDEQLYQEAKAKNEAYIQAITFNEFLPLLLGEGAISQYSGYDVHVNPGISNLFAGAAYRLGHTLLSSEVERLNEDGSIAGSHLSLRDAFFRPDHLQVPQGMEAIFRGVAQGFAQEVDTLIVDDVRNFLFGPPGAGGLDLAALNIQRGRDHGFKDYNSVREAMGLTKVTDFSDITSDVVLQGKLSTLYGSVDNIDLFVGGLAEDPLAGNMLGELLHTIVSEQFTRLRDGDRFWYEGRFTPEEIEAINATSLSDIITRNTDIDHLQYHALKAYQRLGGDDTDNVLIGTDESDLLLGFDGEDSLVGGKGDDELVGGLGNDILDGGEGSDRYVFLQNSGQDTITQFDLFSDAHPDNDLMDLRDYQTSYSNLTISQQGTDTQVIIEGSQHIVLANVDMSDLSQEDFVF